MINPFEILETINMIDKENLDIRTITMGISLKSCADPDVDKACEKIFNKITSYAKDLVKTGEDIEEQFGIPIINKRISVTQRQSAVNALKYAAEGKTGAEIKAQLEKDAPLASIYIAVEKIEYLKKGGRITPAAAMIGTVLNIKPVLSIRGGKIDAYAKTRGMKLARKTMIEAIKKDCEGQLSSLLLNDELKVMIAYSVMDEETIESWQKQVEEAFPGIHVYKAPLSLNVSCHTGPGALGVAVCKKHE